MNWLLLAVRSLPGLLMKWLLLLLGASCCGSTATVTDTSVSVTAEPPVLVGERTGSRLFFPLLQYRLPALAAAGSAHGTTEAASAAVDGPIMLRAQTSPDAEGSAASPNTDAVFISSTDGRNWSYVGDEPVQKRMCHPYPLSADDAPALASIGATLAGTEPEGTLCVPYAFHPPNTNPHPTSACQQRLNAYCNNETLNGAICIDPQLKSFGRKMGPYVGLFDSPIPAAWRCYSHESLNAAKSAWSASSKTPSAFCSGSGIGLARIYASCSHAPTPTVKPQPAVRNASLWVTLNNGTVVKTRGDSVRVTFAATKPMHVAGCALPSKDGEKLLTALYEETQGPDYIVLYEAPAPYTNWSIRARVTPPGEVGNENCAPTAGTPPMRCLQLLCCAVLCCSLLY